MSFCVNDTPPTAIYTLSLHDALPISVRGQGVAGVDRRRAGEVGEAPARLLHHDLARREVPGLEIDLDVHLRLALGHQRVAEIVAKAALTLGGVDETHDAVPDAGLAVEAQA